MAGSYPDTPSRRMAYDDDGTFFGYDADNSAGSWSYRSAIAEHTAQQAIDFNSETNTGVSPPTGSGGAAYGHILIFPELREVDGAIGWNSNGGRAVAAYTSIDTKSAAVADGTWILQDSDITPSGGTRTDVPSTYRSYITSLAVSNVRAFAFQSSGFSARGGHIYGTITPGQTPDRVLIVDTVTGLAFSNTLDFGDVPRGSARDQTFKIRNNSSGLTAGTIQLTAEAITGNSGAWYTFSEGGAFSGTLQLASSIGPGSDSPTLTLRQIIPDSEGLGVEAGRMQVSVGSWT